MHKGFDLEHGSHARAVGIGANRKPRRQPHRIRVRDDLGPREHVKRARAWMGLTRREVRFASGRGERGCIPR
eukprot:1690384-Rhodomonas_salina.2